MTATSFPALSELQHLLSELIRAPEGVQKGVRELVARGDLEGEDLSFAIEANDTMTPQERLDIYATMYFVRVHDCLAEDFARTKLRLGDAHFNNLITDYLLAHPPSHFSLREAGRALPDFLASHSLDEQFPKAGDVARLEWARVDTFDDHDCAPLDRDLLLAASERDPDEFSIRLIPASRMLKVDARAIQYWQSPEAAEADDDEGVVGVVVWRQDFRVRHRRAEEDEERCFDVLANRGITLPELAELLLKPDASAERTSERFAALLELWLRNELLIDARGQA